MPQKLIKYVLILKMISICSIRFIYGLIELQLGGGLYYFKSETK